jgi:diguanylate cyclase (GGDEF)-like protein
MGMHIPTLLAVVLLVGAVLSLSVSAVAHRQQRDGMVFWAAGLGMHTVSYVFFLQQEALGEWAAFMAAIVLRSCAWAAFSEGLCQFYRRRVPRVLIWAPVAIAPLAFALLFEQLAPRIISISLIFGAQSLLALWLMWQARRTTPGRGQYFLMTGLVTAQVFLVLRSMGAFMGTEADMLPMNGEGGVQVVGLVAALVVLLLLSIGFVLMSKDRADSLNRVLATQDSLTGLANRRHLNETLDLEWARASRTGQSLALIMIDIDHFKAYNDHYGHQAGDDCLQRVARTLALSSRRAGDLVARYGGEEFLLVLPHMNDAGGRWLGESIRQAVDMLNVPHAGAPSGRLSVSVGVATTHESVHPDTASLLRAADDALYRAKRAGRNQVQVAEPALA